MKKKEINQGISGNNNIQVAGDLINTNKIHRKNIVTPNYSEHITEAQSKEIKDKVDDIVSGSTQSTDEKKKTYRDIWRKLYNKFNVTSYKLLSKEQFDPAIQFLTKLNAFDYRRKTRRVDNEKWRKEMYTAIYAKSHSLNMDKAQLYFFAESVLELKKQISSITELSDTRLKKLYTKLFNKK